MTLSSEILNLWIYYFILVKYWHCFPKDVLLGKRFFLEKLRLYAHKMLLYFLKFLKTVNKTLLVVVGLTCLCEIVKIAWTTFFFHVEGKREHSPKYTFSLPQNSWLWPSHNDFKPPLDIYWISIETSTVDVIIWWTSFWRNDAQEIAAVSKSGFTITLLSDICSICAWICGAGLKAHWSLRPPAGETLDLPVVVGSWCRSAEGS